MFCGWIQIVTSIYLDSHDHARKPDQKPSFRQISPHHSKNLKFRLHLMGTYRSCLMHPCRNLGNYAELRWTADTFLTTVPVRSRDEEISWLAGFRWGYLENDIPDEKPTLLPLEITDGQAWNQHLAFLRQQYSHWRFKSASA